MPVALLPTTRIGLTRELAAMPRVGLRHAPLPRACILSGPTQLMPESTFSHEPRVVDVEKVRLQVGAGDRLVAGRRRQRRRRRRAFPSDDGNGGAGRLIGLGCSGTSTLYRAGHVCCLGFDVTAA